MKLWKSTSPRVVLALKFGAVEPSLIRGCSAGVAYVLRANEGGETLLLGTSMARPGLVAGVRLRTKLFDMRDAILCLCCEKRRCQVKMQSRNDADERDGELSKIRDRVMGSGKARTPYPSSGNHFREDRQHVNINSPLDSTADRVSDAPVPFLRAYWLP